MPHQQPAPASAATQMVSALPLALSTCQSAETAPTHNGNNRMATIALHHFGTREFSARPPVNSSQIKRGLHRYRRDRGIDDTERPLTPASPLRKGRGRSIVRFCV